MRIIWGVSTISGTSTMAVRPPAQYFLNQTEIDLGLAAAGDALEQHRLRLPGLRQGPDSTERLPPAPR